jgi:hypothetical protein
MSNGVLVQVVVAVQAARSEARHQDPPQAAFTTGAPPPTLSMPLGRRALNLRLAVQLTAAD